MKMMRWLILTVLLACLLCACSAPVEEPEPTTTVPEETTQITEPVTEEVTEPPTEPPVEVARDMIREGAYADALDLLADVEGDEAQMLRLRAGLGDVAVGDEIAFGHFEQDNDTENGAEQIVWIVVGKEGDKALLLSKFCLDTQPFHSKNGSVTWEDSLMRSWLNGEFCDAAFAAAEQQLLAQTELVNTDNPRYETTAGENTVDRVFLLSYDEVNQYLTPSQRCAQVTAYADGRDCYNNASGYAYWWLRSPGVYSRDAMYVAPNGEASLYGYVVNRNRWAVRPAVWIDLSV